MFDSEWDRLLVWGQGYDAGQRGLLKAIASARLSERLVVINSLRDFLMVLPDFEFKEGIVEFVDGLSD